MLKFLNHKDTLYLFTIISINILAHHRIFLSGELNAGDWIYLHESLLKDLHLLNLWVSHINTGWENVVLNNIYFYWFSSFLYNNFSLDWNIITKFFFLAPAIFLTPITSYFFFKKILLNNFAVVSATCFYLFNTFHLKLYLDWITYLYCWWLFPLLLLLIIRYFETGRFRYWFPLVFLYFAIITVELRVSIIIILFSLLFTIYISFCKKNIYKSINFFIKILLTIFLSILLHSSWLLPLIFSEKSHISSYASPSVFRSFYHIIDLLSLRFYGWENTNFLAEVFTRSNNDFRSFILVIVILIGIYFAHRYEKRNYLFYLSILIFSLFISKQSNLPFNYFYVWLFENIPLFNLYRESSKFFIVLALPLSYFFGIGMANLNFSIFKYKIIKLFILLILLIFNTQHFFTGKIGGMSKTLDIPNDYILIRDLIISENSFYRTLWFPLSQRFDYLSMQNPAMSYMFIRDFSVNGEKDCNFYLDNLSVKYFIFQERFKYLADNPFIHGNKEKYLPEIIDCDLELMDIGLERLKVYKNRHHAPLFYLNEFGSETYSSNSKHIDYKIISPNQYEINLNNISGKSNFIFSEKYNQNWSIRIGEFFWYKSLIDKNYYLDSSIHSNNEVNLNVFIFDINQICKLHYCEKNSDGSYNLKITVFYKPSSLFYLGNFFSLILVIFLIGIFFKHLYNFWINSRR